MPVALPFATAQPTRARDASRRGRRAALFSFVAVPLVASERSNAKSSGDYTTDARAVLDAQRALLRQGKGDVEKYFEQADDFFATYKFDHKGHTNSFSQLMNDDAIIHSQAEYLKANGQKWSEDSAPPSGTNKGKMLDAYIANGDRCLVKEGYPPFNEIKKDPETLAAWKAIECTQGLVKPM